MVALKLQKVEGLLIPNLFLAKYYTLQLGRPGLQYHTVHVIVHYNRACDHDQ